MAQVAKCFMSYEDFVADKWVSSDSLIEGRVLPEPQLKYDNGEYKIKTGDKEVDKIIKKEVFAIMYGKQLYLNCRNLRNNDIPLEMSGYGQAYRYGKDQVCVAVYHINDGAFLLGLGADVASFFVDTPMKIGLTVTSTALWLAKDKLNSFRCFLVEGKQDNKGRYETVRMNDAFMENLLADDSKMLAKYQACSNKRARQSAANVLPVLMDKGLVNAE